MPRPSATPTKRNPRNVAQTRGQTQLRTSFDVCFAQHLVTQWFHEFGLLREANRDMQLHEEVHEVDAVPQLLRTGRRANAEPILANPDEVRQAHRVQGVQDTIEDGLVSGLCVETRTVAPLLILHLQTNVHTKG